MSISEICALPLEQKRAHLRDRLEQLDHSIRCLDAQMKRERPEQRQESREAK